MLYCNYFVVIKIQGNVRRIIVVFTQTNTSQLPGRQYGGEDEQPAAERFP